MGSSSAKGWQQAQSYEGLLQLTVTVMSYLKDSESQQQWDSLSWITQTNQKGKMLEKLMAGLGALKQVRWVSVCGAGNPVICLVPFLQECGAASPGPSLAAAHHLSF